MKTLIVAPAWVGDMVMAHSLVSILEQRGDATIHMLAPPATEPLSLRMPGVTGSSTLRTGHGEFGWRKRRGVARELGAMGFDQAIVLPNSFKSALVPFWARIPKRTGWTGESRLLLLNDRRTLDPDRYPLMIERFMALGMPAAVPLEPPYPLPRLTADPERSAYLRQTHDLAAEGITVLCPGAEFGPAKRWPAEHYARVASHEVARGRQIWLLGSPADAPACAAIVERAPDGVRNLAGKTSLLDALDLLALADTVVCNDSGLMHVAGALGRPVIAVFGSTSPGFTPPLGPDARVIQNSLPCSPCFERVCPLGHLRCLKELHPDQVIEAL